MPRAGGAADKIGNRYERLWTVRKLTDVLLGKALSVRIEPPEQGDVGFEFRLTTDQGVEFHQLKRQVDGGNWTPTRLIADGVMMNFLRKAGTPGCICRFISQDSAADMRELTDRARDSVNCEEFLEATQTAKKWQAILSQLRASFREYSDKELFERLTRMFFLTVDEANLRQDVLFVLELLTSRQSENALSVLYQVIDDHIHAELSASDLDNLLRQHGIGLVVAQDIPTLLAEIGTANRNAGIANPSLPMTHSSLARRETEEVLSRIKGADLRGVIITGKAGSGKSGVICAVIASLKALGIPYLALRMDMVESARTASEIASRLGLSYTPGAMLDRVSNNQLSVLVLDQLDFVSLSAGRRPELFQAARQLIDQALSGTNVKIILACREFDRSNDPRLKELLSNRQFAEIPIGPLDRTQVLETLKSAGITAKLGERQLALVSNPLHLSLLLDSTDETNQETPDFSTNVDLYGAYWNRKQELLGLRGGVSADCWNRAISTLADYLSEHRTLSAPRIVLEGRLNKGEVDALISEHVFLESPDRKSISFFHESFFDYAFARTHVANGGTARSLLTSTDQELFRRHQIKQILTFGRDNAYHDYLADLRYLLLDGAVRDHLKESALAFMSDLPNPDAREWKILNEFRSTNERLGWRVWSAVGGSSPWFRQVLASGQWSEWLSSDDEATVDSAIRALYGSLSKNTDDVAALLEAQIDGSVLWNRRIALLSQQRDGLRSERFLALLVQAIAQGALDVASDTGALQNDFGLILHPWIEAAPDLACKVLSALLVRVRELIASSNDPSLLVRWAFNDRMAGSHVSLDDCYVLAREAPAGFLDATIPFLVWVFRTSKPGNEKLPMVDLLWGYRHLDTPHLFSEVLFAGIEESLKNLGGVCPKLFEEQIANLREFNFESAQFLIANALRAHPERYADLASEYLCERESRLKAGYVDAPYWSTMQLLKAISPNCSEIAMTAIEHRVLRYWPRNRGQYGGRWHGFEQYQLLKSIEESRLSAAAQQRLGELSRKFADFDIPKPRKIEATLVKEPIGENSAQHMSDSDWQKAIRKYDGRNSDGSLDLDWGNRDSLVSGAFGDQAARDPNRFVSLAGTLPDDTHPSYFGAVLQALAKVGDRVDAQTVDEFLFRCHSLPFRPLGKEISRLVSARSDDPLSQRRAEILSWYACFDPDPAEELWSKRSGGDGDYLYGGDIESFGINCARGEAALAISTLVWKDADRFALFQDAIQSLVRDPSVAVRSAAIEILVSLQNVDKHQAVALFLRLCQDTDDRLLSTRSAFRFLYYALPTHVNMLEGLLVRMSSSDFETVVTAGAEHRCLVSLSLPKERGDFLGEVVHLSASERRGAAVILAANVGEKILDTELVDGLCRFFFDEDEEVRERASKCFDSLRGKDLTTYESLFESFIGSPAFIKHFRYALDCLQNHEQMLPEIVCKAIERFMDIAGGTAAGIATQAAAIAADCSEMIVRLYSVAETQEVRTRCLDAIDRMFAVGVWSVERTVDAFHDVDR